MTDTGCQYIVGFISREQCNEKPVFGVCISCNINVCHRHGLSTEEGIFCRKCLAKQESVRDELKSGAITAYDRETTDIEESFWDDLS